MVVRDKDIREPLFEYLELQYGKIRIIEEKTMGRSRADVVMVTEESLVGIEIKSDADTYTRLKRQVRDYDKYFDFNYVVVGTTHAHHIKQHVPQNWGIITVELDEHDETTLDFYMLRQAERNVKRDLLKKMGFLWRNELANILASAGMPKYTGKSKRFIAEKLVEKILEEELDRLISEELFERDYSFYMKSN